MTLKALRPKPAQHSFWQKLAMTMGCLIVFFIGGPFVYFGMYMFQQATLFGMLLGLAIGFFGVSISLWSLVLVFRVWGNRWPWKETGEPIS